jgi:hypothetical protein
MPESVRVSSKDQPCKQKGQLHGHMQGTRDAKASTLAGYPTLPTGIGKSRSASRVGVHAAALSRVTMPQSAHTGHILIQLQRQCGNRYVQRVAGSARTEKRVEVQGMDIPINATYLRNSNPGGQLQIVRYRRRGNDGTSAASHAARVSEDGQGDDGRQVSSKMR